MKTKLISLFLCLLCQSASADWVRGDPDCGVWVKPETPTREIENRAWLIGFLSGVNMGFTMASSATVGKRTPEFSFDTTNEQTFLWMDIIAVSIHFPLQCMALVSSCRRGTTNEKKLIFISFNFYNRFF